jgi:hypothetical protein
VHDEAVGVMTPDGQFALLALNDGHALVEEKLAPEPNLSEIYVLRGSGQYILATNRPVQMRNSINRQAVVGGIGCPLLTGHVYIFDRSSGKKIGSMQVDRQGLSLYQPAALPVLTFATHIYDQRKNRSHNVEAEIICVDKRTGKIVHDEKLSQPVQQGLDISGDPERHQVILKAQGTQGVSLRLTFTGKEAPAEGTSQAGSKKETETAKAGKAVMKGLQNWFQIMAPQPAALMREEP